jgi:hypothetical protein
MEKDTNFSIDDKGKGNYIIRSTGSFNPEDYIKTHLSGKELDKEEYKFLVENAIVVIYDNLIEKQEGKSLDTVGIWLTFDNGEVIENALDIPVLESMAEFGEKDIIPILEFAKMTVEPFYESEVS